VNLDHQVLLHREVNVENRDPLVALELRVFLVLMDSAALVDSVENLVKLVLQDDQETGVCLDNLDLLEDQESPANLDNQENGDDLERVENEDHKEKPVHLDNQVMMALKAALDQEVNQV